MRDKQWLKIWDKKYQPRGDVDVHAMDGFETLSKDQWKVLSSFFLGLCEIGCGDYVLEVGCGAGAMLMEIKECQGLAGVDYAKDSIDIACQNLKGNFLVAEANNLPFEDNRFDVVCAWSVWQYFPSYEYAAEAVREMNRVAKKEGRLIIGDVNDVDKKAERRKYLDRLESRKKVGGDITPSHMFYDKDFFRKIGAELGRKVTFFDEDIDKLDFYMQSRWRYSVKMI